MVGVGFGDVRLNVALLANLPREVVDVAKVHTCLCLSWLTCLWGREGGS